MKDRVTLGGSGAVPGTDNPPEASQISLSVNEWQRRGASESAPGRQWFLVPIIMVRLHEREISLPAEKIVGWEVMVWRHLGRLQKEGDDGEKVSEVKMSL